MCKTENKETTFRVSSDKTHMAYRGIEVIIKADIASEIMQARSQWIDICKVIKEKTVNPEYLLRKKYFSKVKQNK